VVRLAPTAAPDAFTGVLLVATTATLLLWKLPVIPAALGGGILGVLARSRLVL
jgi:hypothetical protein